MSICALTLTLLPVGVAVGAPSNHGATARYLQQQLSWAPCMFGLSEENWKDLQEQGYVRPDCAMVTVPRDWNRPGTGPDLKIAISRISAVDRVHRKGVLFTNPGGPGGGGVMLPMTFGDAGARQNYDVIGMDPRGVKDAGGSTPLNCDLPADEVASIPDHDARDTSREAIADQRKFAELVADACAKNPLTPYIDTWQTAYDIDLVRALLGESKLNYLGYSYGSWLGSKYASLFPRNTGKMILDSNTAWMDPLHATFDLQAMGFQRRFAEQFAPWSARQICDAACTGDGTTQGPLVGGQTNGVTRNAT